MEEKKLGLKSVISVSVGLVIATSCLVSLGQGAGTIGVTFIFAMVIKYYLLTRYFSLPFTKKSTICLAAAIPALILASAVWAPIFFGVLK